MPYVRGLSLSFLKPVTSSSTARQIRALAHNDASMIVHARYIFVKMSHVAHRWKMRSSYGLVYASLIQTHLRVTLFHAVPEAIRLENREAKTEQKRDKT